MTYVDLRPDNVRLVEVLADDGRWYRGELPVYRREDDVWSGWVRWTAGGGETYVGWFAEDRLRKDGAAPVADWGGSDDSPAACQKAKMRSTITSSA